MRLLLSFLLTLSALLIPISSVSDDTRPYISNVGIGQFNLFSPKLECPKLLSSLRKLPVWHIAALYNTFGSDYSCFRRIKQSEKLQTFQLNLLNEPGHRNKRLGSYEFLRSISTPAEFEKLMVRRDGALKAKFVAYTERARRELSTLPSQVQCIINPGLESNLSDKAGAVLVQWTRELFPDCRVVWGPLRATTQKTGTAGADLVEGHGELPPVSSPCVVNLDGTDINFPSRKSIFGKESYIESGTPLQQYIHNYANKCELVYLWTAEMNCIESTSFLDPRKRVCSSRTMGAVAHEAQVAMTTIRQFRSYKWTDEENKSLTSCDSFRLSHDGTKRGFLLKQSEFNGRGGVILLPHIKGSKVVVLHNGRIVDTYTNSGVYGHDGQGRPMWRSNISPTKYPYHVVVQVKVGTKNVCVKVENPKERND